MAHRFEVVREARRAYGRINTIGTQLTVRLNPPYTPDANPVDHFQASENDLFETCTARRGRRGHVGDRYS